MSRVFIVGGGTGGHIVPAVALADELVARGIPAEDVIFLGAARGMERELVPAAGYAIHLLPGRGITRSFSLQNVKSVFAILRGIFQAIGITRKLRPDVIVGFGGYASVAGMLAGVVLRIPRVVHEQNAAPGLANRLAVRCGAQPTVGFPVPAWPQAVQVGNPVRTVFTTIKRSVQYPLEVLVVGGSLGARTLNNIGVAVAHQLAAIGNPRLTIVAGERDVERVRAAVPTGVVVESFVNNLAERYSTAAVVIARAGALTVAELACVGVPSILVPLPGAPGDHQTANATWLQQAGGAVCIPDTASTVEECIAILKVLLSDAERRSAMEISARGAAQPDAAQRLAEVVERYV